MKAKLSKSLTFEPLCFEKPCWKYLEFRVAKPYLLIFHSHRFSFTFYPFVIGSGSLNVQLWIWCVTTRLLFNSRTTYHIHTTQWLSEHTWSVYQNIYYCINVFFLEYTGWHYFKGHENLFSHQLLPMSDGILHEHPMFCSRLNSFSFSLERFLYLCFSLSFSYWFEVGGAK